MAIKAIFNEKELITLIMEGDERSFSILFRHYAKPLSVFVFDLTKSVEITEDIIQNCFVKIWINRLSLNKIENIGGYLYTICRNESIYQLKKIAKKEILDRSLEKELGNEMLDGSEQDLIEEYRIFIAEAVEKLPPQQQKIYKMSRYNKLKYQEIAQQLNLSPDTVKKHVQLAVKFIEKDVKGRVSLIVVLILTSKLF